VKAQGAPPVVSGVKLWKSVAPATVSDPEAGIGVATRPHGAGRISIQQCRRELPFRSRAFGKRECIDECSQVTLCLGYESVDLVVGACAIGACSVHQLTKQRLLKIAALGQLTAWRASCPPLASSGFVLSDEEGRAGISPTPLSA